MTAPPTDTYGNPVRRPHHRHPLCTCPVPCQRRFRCDSFHHEGPRWVPWCNGGGDDSLCDDCWSHHWQAAGCP